MLDFGALPPEINSGRMYAGPGSGSMLAASAAWDALAAELGSAAAGYHSAISELIRSKWVGPASASMVAATAPYAAWLNATSRLAEQSGMQARAAAAAYELAFAMTVPPQVIAANRSLLATLVATNFFGQNTPAIAATEAQYAEMWAQDATAMYSYAGSSSAAAQLTPFAPAPATTSAGALAAQSAAVEAAAATTAGSSAQTVSSMTTELAVATAMPQAVNQYLSSELLGLGPLGILGLIGSLTVANRVALVRTFTGLPYFTLGMAQTFVALGSVMVPGNPASAGGSGSSVADYWGPSVFSTLSATPTATTTGPTGYAPGGLGTTIGRAPLEGLHWAQNQPSAAASQMSVAVGKTHAIKGLSVPSGWVENVPQQTVTDWEAPENFAPVRGGGVNAILRGYDVAGGAHQAGGFIHKYGFRYKVMMRPPYGG